jgi:hypothetical protein
MFSKISTFTVAVAAVLAAHVAPASAQITKPSAVPVPTLPTATVAPHNLLLPPPSVTAPPPGISVTLQNCALVPGDASGAPFSIGMASTFDINTTAQAGPATGMWAGGQVGTGTIQFADGNNVAVWLANCHAQNILPRMTITNVSSSGTVVYDMPNVLVTGQQFGSAISYSFDYLAINWTVSSPGGTLLSRNSCMYTGNQRGCR